MKSTFLLATIVLAGFLFAGDAAAQSIRVRQNDESYSYNRRDGRYELDVRIKGEITLTDDDRGVAAIERGGYLEIDESRAGESHEIRIDGGSGGQLDYTYRRNGRRVEFDEEGRAWFADVLLEVIRESGLAAESRTERILRQDGVDGVLDEVDQIQNGSSRVRYLSHLFDEAKLNTAQLNRAARLAEEIGAPGDLTRVLMHMAPSFMADEAAIPAFFDAATSIGAPGDKTRLLIHLVDEGLLESETAYLGALETSGTIGAPGDRARFLIAAAPAYMPVARGAYFESVNGIGAPGDHARVLLSLIEAGNMDRASSMDLYRSAERIGAPGDKARVLIEAVDQVSGDPDLADAYLDAASSIGAPGDHARVLISLLKAGDLDKSVILKLLKNVHAIGAPGDMTRVLLEAAPQVAGDDDLVETYLEVVDQIGAPGDQKRALEALLQ